MAELALRPSFSLPKTRPKRDWNPPKWLYPILYHKKAIIIITAILLIVAAVFTIGFADTTDNLRKEYKDKIITCLFEMVNDLFGGEDVAKFKSALAIKADMNFSYSFSGSGSDFTVNGTEILNFINPIYKLFQTLGIDLLILFWTIGFYEMLTRANGQILLENLAKKFLFIVVGFAMVLNAKEVVLGVIDITGSLTVAVANKSTLAATANSGPLKAALDGIIEGTDSISGIITKVNQFSVFLSLIIPWVISKLANMAILMYCFEHYVEVCLTIIVSPLMFSDFSNTENGLTHTSAFRAIKTILSLGLQGALMLATLYIFTSIGSGALNNLSFDGLDWFQTQGTIVKFGTCIAALYAAKLGFVGKVKSFAKQLF